MVFGQLYAFFVFTLSCFLSKTVQADSSKESFSFISLDKESNLDIISAISSTADVISSVDSAIAIFEFDNFSLSENMIVDEEYPFFDRFFSNDVTLAVNDESPLNISQSLSPIMEQFTVDELPQSASDLLYEYSLDDKSIVLFKFTSDSYDLKKLDEFIESCLLFLEDKSGDDLTVVINSIGTFDADDNEYATEGTLSHHDNDKGKDSDDDILSSIWTEGLLMCLIVSALLLFILIIALSWISNLDITYGALEKSTNPIKKNN
ncbi:Voa1p [Saccharomyces paradoxus]|uniref:Voa1p n=1 Tax=Saccharomyces paradoxus TaxID=27291 RepID=A0A8B8URT1_SACPA|nr:Voa1 [Saccharomyces paradoxus]QHS73417.1 Voa1 [Saccharomyces paradoxus]